MQAVVAGMGGDGLEVLLGWVQASADNLAGEI